MQSSTPHHRSSESKMGKGTDERILPYRTETLRESKNETPEWTTRKTGYAQQMFISPV